MFLGKLIGMFLGYQLLGPLGAFLGFSLGDWIEKSLYAQTRQMPGARSQAIQHAFFKATFSVMGHIAKADGVVSENELEAAKHIMSRLDLNEEFRREAMLLFNRGKKTDFDLAKAVSALFEECRGRTDLLRFFIEIQIEAGLSDGQLHPAKRRILLFICQMLHFSQQEFEQLWSRQWASQSFHQWFSSQFDPHRRTSYSRGHAGNAEGARTHQSSGFTRSSSLEDAYGVLGVQNSATNSQIKVAYRRLMNQHHPDKLAARGLPENMVKLAKEKAQSITAAYELIRKERGFR